MPWTVDDVDSHKKGLDDKGKRQWVAVANSALKRCLDDGGDEKECAASAIRQANGVAGNEEMQIHHYHLTANNYTIRTETHQGRKHLVVPVVMMVEGVHNGSHGPLLHLSEELGKFPASWNGIPISVQHPSEDGVDVSANDPNIVDGQVIGRVYRTRMDKGKLKAEAWLDEDKMQRVAPDALAYIRQGKPLDVSVGVFTDDELIVGDYGGKEYAGIARNHRPDHLALLPGGVGACSWADGCGIRTNFNPDQQNEESMQTNTLRYSGTESTAWTGPALADFKVEGQWGDLSASERAMVASHFLIGSADAETFGDLKLPVVNPGTGKLNERALRAVISGRGAQVGGVSAEQKAAARRRAYRLLNEEFEADLKVPDNLEESNREEAIMAHEEKRHDPCCPEKVELLIQSEQTRFDEADRDWLLDMTEDQIAKLMPLEDEERAQEEVPAMNQEQALQVLQEQLSDPKKFLSLLPQETREQMEFGLKLYKAERSKFIDRITANTDVFTAEELGAKSMDELDKLSRAVKPRTDFTPMGGGALTVHEVEALLPPGVE